MVRDIVIRPLSVWTVQFSFRSVCFFSKRQPIDEREPENSSGFHSERKNSIFVLVCSSYEMN